MRASQLFIPTLREDPGDAEAVSHKLLVRGGFIRQVSAGLWSCLDVRVLAFCNDRACGSGGGTSLRTTPGA